MEDGFAWNETKVIKVFKKMKYVNKQHPDQWDWPNESLAYNILRKLKLAQMSDVFLLIIREEMLQFLKN